MVGQIFHGCIEGNMLALCNRLIIHHGDGIFIEAVPTRGFDCSLCNAQVYIRDNQIGVNFLENAQPCTIFASPIGVVERKHPRGQLFNGNIMFRTGVFLRKQPCFFPHDFYRCQAARQGKDGFQAVCQTGTNPLFDHQSVYHDFNGMLFVLVQRDGF